LASSRFWHFALVALLGTIVAAAMMAVLYRYVTVDNFQKSHAEQNVELARALSNTHLEDVEKLRAIAATNSWAEMQVSPEIADFAATIDRELNHLAVYMVNFFDPNGLVLYSTDRRSIGARVHMNEGVELAASGQEVSAIVRRDSFNRFDRVVADRDMIETYIPLTTESGEVIAVFEIHSDISDFFARVGATQRTIAIGAAATLMLLYALLLLVFWRSDHLLFAGTAPRSSSRRRGNESDMVNRAKSEFVATISHEIRTPLNAVLGMTDLLNLTSLTRKQREYIHTIQSSGDMLISLIDNLLDYSDLEIGDLELQVSDFDVVDLIERVLHIMGHSASAKNLNLVGDIQHDLDLRVSADKRRLQQILVNIVNNAVKFTETGEVVVEASVTDEAEECLRLRFTVTDTGPGIDEITRERLFAAFASGIRPDSSQTYGSGLGLTISKRLLDSMGGSIEIATREQGGTRVVVEVPVTRADVSWSSQRSAHPEGRLQRVFSMFASHAQQKSICRLLEQWDIRCERTSDIEEGLHQLKAAASSGKPFDCAIIDSALTPQDHLLLVRRIRNSAETANLPIILLTSISKPLGIGEVTELGRLICVNKPVLPLKLRFNLLQSVREKADSRATGNLETDIYADSNDLRILIAEDNPVSSRLLQNMLHSEGFGADIVEDGPSVLEALQTRKYDLLLLDCQMPGMDGDLVTQNIREYPERYGNDPIIVAVTADTTERHREQCLAAGMDDFMSKPIRLESLRGGMARWVEMSAARGNAENQEAFAHLRRNLVDRTGHSEKSFLSDYIGLFLDDTQARLDRMSQAFASGEADAVQREGHALKGACLELGADRMARFCEDLSVAANNDNLDEVAAVLEKLDREFDRLRPVYESAQDSSTSPS
jgi:signal transduction histidine kinase/CheY-like chemotaxis protein